MTLNLDDLNMRLNHESNRTTWLIPPQGVNPANATGSAAQVLRTAELAVDHLIHQAAAFNANVSTITPFNRMTPTDTYRRLSMALDAAAREAAFTRTTPDPARDIQPGYRVELGGEVETMHDISLPEHLIEQYANGHSVPGTIEREALNYPSRAWRVYFQSDQAMWDVYETNLVVLE